jgi:hypothetical protein
MIPGYSTQKSIGCIPMARSRDSLLDWGNQPQPLEGSSHSSGLLLYKSADGQVESGLWQCTPGRWRLSIPGDELCYFQAGRSRYVSDKGETINVVAGNLVHFEPGWSGECTVLETVRNTYMLCAGTTHGTGSQHRLEDPVGLDETIDWGRIPTMLEGDSYTSGRLLHKGPGGRSETGVWICTPGYWNCHVTSDEYCHFLSGRCTYVHESGEVIEIGPDTATFFPKDWRGTCRVHETVRKVYMIR